MQVKEGERQMKKRWIRSGLCLALAGIMALSVVGCKGEEEVETEEKPTVRTDFTDYVPEINSSGTLSETFGMSDYLEANVDEIVTVSATSAEINNIQGGCYVGDYFYQAFIRKDEGSEEVASECIIVKCDVNTGEIVAESDVYQMNHLNDIEYNSKLDCLVIVHGIPLRNIISYVDADTLELIDTFTIPEYIWSLTYNAKRDQYVVGISGGQKFKILDSEFNAITDEIEPNQISCTTQAASCDDDYIYFVMYKPSCVMVYDWDGNFVTRIDIKLPVTLWETESVMARNGELYVGCADITGNYVAALYKLHNFQVKEVVEEEK